MENTIHKQNIEMLRLEEQRLASVLSDNLSASSGSVKSNQKIQALQKAKGDVSSALAAEEDRVETSDGGSGPPFIINKASKSVFGRKTFGIGDTDTHFPVPLHKIKQERVCTSGRCDVKSVPSAHQQKSDGDSTAPVIDITTPPRKGNMAQQVTQSVKSPVKTSDRKKLKIEATDTATVTAQKKEKEKKYMKMLFLLRVS